MSRANHRVLFLLDQVYFVTDCVAWVLSGSRCPHVVLEGSLLPGSTVLKVVGHPASQCQGPECSFQVPLP